MSREAYTVALRNALTEIRNVCPDVQTSFLFDKEAKLVAGDSEAPEATMEKVAGSMEVILGKADTIGGLNSLVIEGNKNNLQISRVNDMYLTMVSSRNADTKFLETVARVLIPTVIKLLDTLGPTPLKQYSSSHTLLKPELKYEPSKTTRKEYSEEEIQEENEIQDKKVDEEEEPKPDMMRARALPSNQLIVESFGGLLVRSDTVQISQDIMSQWENTLEGKKIDLVEIESFKGKTSQCKVKTVDDSKLENKAVIRIPEKLCQTLDIKKGELVRVKPIVN